MKTLLFACLLALGCTDLGPAPPAGVDAAQVQPDAAQPDASVPPQDSGLVGHPSSEFGLPIDMASMWPECTNGQNEPAVQGPVFICYGSNGKPRLSREGRVCYICDNLKTPCSASFAGWDIVCLSICEICNLV